MSVKKQLNVEKQPSEQEQISIESADYAIRGHADGLFNMIDEWICYYEVEGASIGSHPKIRWGEDDGPNLSEAKRMLETPEFKREIEIFLDRMRENIYDIVEKEYGAKMKDVKMPAIDTRGSK